ncbi:MAG: hypothetical protein EOM65_15715 [Synergistales bacterium]|nr:hypothetical protein [Synergistales bacterium]
MSGWIDYGTECPVRPPLIARISLVGDATCRVGSTVFLGQTFRDRPGNEPAGERKPPRSCLLFFVTPHWLTAQPAWPRPQDFASAAGQLLVEEVDPATFGWRSRGRWSAPTSYDWDDGGRGVDWGDEDSESESENRNRKTDYDEEDDGYWEDWEPSELARRLRTFTDHWGLTQSPGARVFYIDSRLVLFAPAADIKMMRTLLMPMNYSPRKQLVVRSAAIRLSPELWQEWMPEPRKEYGESDRTLSPKEVQHLLQLVAKDKQSRILCSSALLRRASYSSTLDDKVEILAPETWHQYLLEKKAVWLPDFDDWEEVGLSLAALSGNGDFWEQAPVECRMEWTELAGWDSCGPTLGFPRYRHSRLPDVTIRPGDGYLLLVGAGNAKEGYVVWLLSASWLSL